MGLITQTSPIVASTISGISADYTNQILTSGGTGQLNFQIVNPNVGLEISETGAIITTGMLLDDDYTISGTVTDLHGNAGTWVFTLTVVGGTLPQTSVTPVQAAMPNQSEILVPFQIDSATGGVAQITDYKTILAQHIQTIIMTAPGERVMNPSYGVGLDASTFSPSSQVDDSALASDIQRLIARFEPAVKVWNTSISSDPSTPNVITVSIDYSVLPFQDVSTVTVTTGGPILQVSG